MNQNAFVPGRLITENSLMAYEMVKGFNRQNSNNLCLKVGLHKAYDRIDTEFVHRMLICMGFPYKFANLAYECISAPSFSILVNGSHFVYFDSSRVLRQGDPLSLYLFSISMEFLTIMPDLEFLSENLQPIYQVETIITNLLYADDILIMSKATIVMLIQ